MELNEKKLESILTEQREEFRRYVNKLIKDSGAKFKQYWRLNKLNQDLKVRSLKYQ